MLGDKDLKITIPENSHYGLKKGLDRLSAANVINHSLSNFEELVKVAAEEKYISEADINKLLKFQSNPSDPSWME